MQLISSEQWAAYRQVINNASDTFNAEVITWKHLIKKLDYHGDDRYGNVAYEEISLNVLIAYNVYRVWPIDKLTDKGFLAKDSAVLIINKDYLRGLGYINTNGNFNFNPDMDRFIINGVLHKCMGDTEASQAHDDPLLEYIIVVREEVPTGTPSR
jgi:hypothetical protein